MGAYLAHLDEEKLDHNLRTAKSHVHRILEKLDVSCRTQATVKALQLGIVKL